MHGGEKSGCSATEKALLLAYALKWRKKTNTLSAEQLKESEKEIWLSHIHAMVEETDGSVSCVVPAGLMYTTQLHHIVLGVSYKVPLPDAVSASLSTSHPQPCSQPLPREVGKEPGNKATPPTTCPACTHTHHHPCLHILYVQITLSFLFPPSDH